MVDLRYFVVTLVAVFLALALGLLIGANLPPEEGLTGRQEAIIRQLEAEFGRLRSENRFYGQRLAAMEVADRALRELESSLAPALLAGKLEGRRFAVVATTPDAPLALVAGALELAGASVVPVQPDFSLGPSGERLAAMVLGEGGDAAPVAVEAVVVAGGSSGAGRAYAAEVELPLLSALRAAGTRVVGVERSDAWHSSMPTFKSELLCTVSHVDRLPGQLALVYLLSDTDRQGAFGLGEGELPLPVLAGSEEWP